jgi:CheY-like chemotaxis protein/HPt (histidine-containing phosphotransfer) domain-containing protein
MPEVTLSRPLRRREILEAVDQQVAAARSSPSEEKQGGDLAMGPGRVLLVEDSPVNQKVALGMLRRLGCQAEIAENGVEALRLLAARAYDLVLMDCQMPVMDGATATRVQREREAGTAAHVPIIAMTAHALHGDREWCLAAGMDDYLAKPVQADALERVLERWIPGRFVPAARRPGPQRNMTAEREILDPAVLAGLREIEARAAGFVGEVVALFTEQGQVTLDALSAAGKAGDLPAWRGLLHTLKGSASSVGALRLADRCRELDFMTGSEGLVRAVRALSNLEEEYQLARAQLERQKVRHA